jgi:hypothetical protein
VITDLHGVTGQDIMNHLIAPKSGLTVLALLARSLARPKIAQLEEVLEGAEFFAPDDAALLAVMLLSRARPTGLSPGQLPLPGLV